MIGGTLKVLHDAVLFREDQVADRAVVDFVQGSSCGLVKDQTTIPHESGEANVALVTSDGVWVFQQVFSTAMFDEFAEGLEELSAATTSFTGDRNDLVVWTIDNVRDEGWFRNGQVTVSRYGSIVVTKSRWIFISG